RPPGAAGREPAAQDRQQRPAPRAGRAARDWQEMSWLVGNWQLKLLALVMSLGLFAAVAFEANPLTAHTFTATIEYDGIPADTIPIQVTVDDRASVAVPIDTRITYAEGWTGVADKIVVTPATLNLVGAASELKDLKAFVAPSQPIAASTADIPSLAIQFVRNGHTTTLPTDTNPPTSVDSALT